MNDVALHPEVFVDLDGIRRYAAERYAGEANALLDEIHSAIRTLIAFPRRGHLRPDLTSRNFRFVLVHDFLIAYAPDPLFVIAVVHGRRNPRSIASTLRGRA